MTIARRATGTPRPLEAGRAIPIWHESFWPADWMALRMSSVYSGRGVTRGDGSPVVVIPGFLCGDAVMYELFSWLGRVGYRPFLSGIAMNVDCPGATATRVARTVARVHRQTGRRVRIVGHSLGGMIGRHVALENPHTVDQLIYLGSPIQGVHAHPAVVAAATVLAGARNLMGSHDRCLADGCGAEFAQDVSRPLDQSIHHAAIYTRSDGVVDYHDSQEQDPMRNFEVGGTHIGLVYNPRAYEVLGRLLAARSVQSSTGRTLQRAA